MTTLENRPNTALIVIDVQAGVVAGNYEVEAVLANIRALVGTARTDGVAVVWVQDHAGGRAIGSDAWQIAGDLGQRDDDPHVDKEYGDAFEATELESVLERLGAGRLIVAGAQTDACIRSTLHGAIARGYDATLVSDAHTTEDLSDWGAPTPDMVIAHTNLYWQDHTAPGRVAGIIPTAEVSFADLRPV